MLNIQQFLAHRKALPFLDAANFFTRSLQSTIDFYCREARIEFSTFLLNAVQMDWFTSYYCTIYNIYEYLCMRVTLNAGCGADCGCYCSFATHNRIKFDGHAHHYWLRNYQCAYCPCQRIIIVHITNNNKFSILFSLDSLLPIALVIMPSSKYSSKDMGKLFTFSFYFDEYLTLRTERGTFLSHVISVCERICARIVANFRLLWQIKKESLFRATAWNSSIKLPFYHSKWIISHFRAFFSSLLDIEFHRANFSFLDLAKKLDLIKIFHAKLSKLFYPFQKHTFYLDDGTIQLKVSKIEMLFHWQKIS